MAENIPDLSGAGQIQSLPVGSDVHGFGFAAIQQQNCETMTGQMLDPHLGVTIL